MTPRSLPNCCLSVVFFLAPTWKVLAATLTVTNLTDNGPGSLRQAIAEASAGDTVNFAITGTVALTSDQLLITNDLTVVGPGASNLAISPTVRSRVFEIASFATVTITGLSIQYGDPGQATDNSGSSGGGVYNSGSLTLEACTITGNNAGRGSPSGNGGGIYNLGALTLNNCTISSNSIYLGYGDTGGSGGGIFNAGTLAMFGCSVLANRAGLTEKLHAAGGGSGGALYNIGRASCVSCNFIGNAGGAGSYSGTPGGAGGSGGAIYNADTLTLTNCTFSSNSGGVGADGAADSSGHSADGGGGGSGGAIYNSVSLTLTCCTFGGNNTGRGGKGGDGSIYYGQAGTGGAGGSGGAVYNSGTVVSVASTWGGNSCGAGGAGGSNSGLPYMVYGANGGDGGSGGNIFDAATISSVTLRNSLVAQSSTGLGGPAGDGRAGWGVPGADGTGPALAGPFTSQGHNLIGQTNGASGFTNGLNADLAGSSATPLDPKLGLLQNNGGATLTMALLPGSLAIDAGDDALLLAPFNLATDQRGFSRRSGAHVDIGAFEVQWASAPLRIGTPTKLNNGSCQLTFSNTPGASFSMLAASDVALPSSNWIVLGPATETAPGRFQFIDPQAASNAQRFYGVASP